MVGGGGVVLLLGLKLTATGAEGSSLLLLALKSTATEDSEGPFLLLVSNSEKRAPSRVRARDHIERGGGGHKLPSTSRSSEGAHREEGGGEHKLPSVLRSSEGARRKEGGGHKLPLRLAFEQGSMSKGGWWWA